MQARLHLDHLVPIHACFIDEAAGGQGAIDAKQSASKRGRQWGRIVGDIELYRMLRDAPRRHEDSLVHDISARAQVSKGAGEERAVYFEVRVRGIAEEKHQPL